MTVVEPAAKPEVQERALAPMTAPEITFLAAILIAALAFYFASDPWEMRVLLFALLGLNIALVVVQLRQTLRTGVPGKTLLAISMTIFFWLDAVPRAFDTPSPFSPSDLTGPVTMPLSIIRAA